MMQESDKATQAIMSTSILPSDGTIIRVSEWRRQILWVGTVVFGFVGFSVVISAIQIGRPLAIIPALIAVGVIVASIRMPLGGIILERTGVKARSLWWTYRWHWNEIERFELRKRGETPRFRVHLKDGNVRGFLGFFARTPEEEARAKELFQALQDRLQIERSQS
jgi:hypothetical protein